ncbi:hypothetical protein [Caenispirillum salinarum]|uniref:hypothetical protein n=1 Tax=Caenispirillum salinarum TaxID=859058 RepID=UPI00384EBB79
MLIFLDIAASAPEDGVPAEIAWAAADLSAAASWLIRPAPDWDESLYAPDAGSRHGLTRPMLEADGREPRRVAMLLAEDLAGATVASADPAGHEALLDRLYEAAPFPRPFALRDADGLRRARWGDPAEADRLRARAAARLEDGPALDGAVDLALAWSLASGGDAGTSAEAARALIAREGR